MDTLSLNLHGGGGRRGRKAVLFGQGEEEGLVPDTTGPGLLDESTNPKPDPEAEERTRRINKQTHGLGSYVTGVGIFALIMNLVLIVYYAVVFLNLTFTFPPQFPQSAVPFYTEPASSSDHRLATRYHSWWFLVAVGLLRLLSVNGSFKAMALASHTADNLGLWIMYGWLLVFMLVDVFIGFYFAWTWVFTARCADVPICRSWDAEPTDSSDIAGVANWVFGVLAWFTVAFVIVHVALFFCVKGAIERLRLYKKKKKGGKGKKP